MLDAELKLRLVALSKSIHANPEISGEEHFACDELCALLGSMGLPVERHVGDLDTAFRSRVGSTRGTVALLAEYDALPELGHGCGHNLIAMAMVAAFLELVQTTDDLRVGVALVGTPAEERGGGKIQLLNRGAFEDCVAAISTHPSGDLDWSVSARSLGSSVLRVTFHGVASHAASAPELGRSALSSVVSLFVASDAWRQRLDSHSRIHGIITDGGRAFNVVPDRAEALFGIRADDADTLVGMIQTFRKMAQAAADLTETTVDVEEALPAYAPMSPNPVIGSALQDALKERSITCDMHQRVAGSTDLGNVSSRIPTNWIRFPVSTQRIPGHSFAMRDACVGDYAHQNALLVGSAVASAVRRLGSSDEALSEMRRSSVHGVRDRTALSHSEQTSDPHWRGQG